MAPVPGELGPRKGGLPRNLPPPEHNLIQNPTITRGIARNTGLRQAHVLPALQEGLSAQLLAGDIREDPRTGVPRTYAVMQEQVPDNVNVKRWTFVNPHDSERVAVIRRLHVYAAPDWILAQVTTPSPVPFVYNTITPTTFVLDPTIVHGIRLVTGYVVQKNGVAIPQPPQASSATDVVFPIAASVMGFHSPQLTGIDGGYFWEGILGQPIGFEIEEDFHRDYGPRIIVFPGGCFQMYALDNTFHAYGNLWWDEYPLS